MILNISQSSIFKINPDTRFAKEYSVPIGAWNEVWFRYKVKSYSTGDIRDYLFVKYARNLKPASIRRWVMRSEVYMISSPLIKRGVKHVDSVIFKEWEQELMDYLTQTLKNNGATKSRIII